MTRAPSRLDTKNDDRDKLAAEALLSALPTLPEGGLVLVVDDRTGQVEEALQLRGHPVHVWRRMAVAGQSAAAWPDTPPCVAAVVRLPKGKEALELSLHGAAAVLAPESPVFVYGANDEGIKTVGKRMEPLFSNVETIDARRHCRVVRAERPADPPGLRASLAEHRKVVPIEVDDESFSYVAYPGVFAQGQLDAGSAALLSSLPKLPDGAQILDYASGAGLLSMVLSRRHPSASFQLIDADAVAVAAARENMPGQLVLCGDSWGRLPAYRRYDLIMSNPPIHTGKGRDYTMLTRLIEGAPARLLPKGSLWLVVQRQVPIHTALEDAFDDVSVAFEDNRYRVWRAGRLSDRYGV